MKITSYGYFIPEAGDSSATKEKWMEKLSKNWVKQDIHSHDGINSPLVNFSNIQKKTKTIEAVDWEIFGNKYRAKVIMPSGYDFDNAYLKVNIDNFPHTYHGAELNPTITQYDSTSFWLYTIDNTLRLKVRFL